MKIIKRGEPPQEKIHQQTCSHRKSELEFKQSEVQWSPDQRDIGQWFVICPVCTKHVWGTAE